MFRQGFGLYFRCIAWGCAILRAVMCMSIRPRPGIDCAMEVTDHE